ncbi:MAG: hypothetical protein H7321_06870, partial [Bacteroidia bacterium]|nr:hypothetical protein [Bacteroidia bacterium]
GDTFSVGNYKVLLSNFIFQKEDGSFLNIKNAYGYLSFANGIKSVKVEGIPEGKYKSIAFEVGLDSAINHGDFAQWPATHPLNPVLTGMHWEWKTGYIFHIFEGGFMDNGKVSSFSFHVAQDKNVYKYVFVNDFTVASNVTAEFNAQADSYFSSFINLSLKTDGSFSHSDDVDPLMMKFRGNMQDAFDLVSVK